MPTLVGRELHHEQVTFSASRSFLNTARCGMRWPSDLAIQASRWALNSSIRLVPNSMICENFMGHASDQLSLTAGHRSEATPAEREHPRSLEARGRSRTECESVGSHLAEQEGTSGAKAGTVAMVGAGHPPADVLGASAGAAGFLLRYFPRPADHRSAAYASIPLRPAARGLPLIRPRRSFAAVPRPPTRSRRRERRAPQHLHLRPAIAELAEQRDGTLLVVQGGLEITQTVVRRAQIDRRASTTLDTYGHLWQGDDDRVRAALTGLLNGRVSPACHEDVGS